MSRKKQDQETETTRPLDPIEFHGVVFSGKSGENLLAECPFCGKELHFYANPKTGQWDCKACMLSGNAYTFLEKYHQYWLDLTEETHYKLLAKDRGIPWKVFKRHDLAWDASQGRWLIPIHNVNGKLANLRTWNPIEGELNARTLLSTKGCKNHLYRGHLIRPGGRIYVCEGEWDAMAWDYLLRAGNLQCKDDADQRLKELFSPENFSVVGVPGCTFLSSKSCKNLQEMFQAREIILLYDKDPPKIVSPATKSKPARTIRPGYDGMVKAAESLAALSPSPRSIRWLQWPDEAVTLDCGLDIPGPDTKFDIRDYVTAARAVPTPQYTYAVTSLLKHLKNWEIPEDNLPRLNETIIPDIIRTKFSEVVQDFRENLHVDPAFVDALRLVTAAVFSEEIPGDPIWMFLVGPPGSGKTTIVEAFGRSNQHVEAISKLTAKALISGWKTDSGEDVSFLPLLHHKTLVVKDYTAVLSMPTQVQEELYGILRDVYDGVVRIPYGNNQVRYYPELDFSCVFAVTDEIHRDNRSTLGERFLKVELLGDSHDEASHIRAAMHGFYKKKERTRNLTDSAIAFMNHTKQRFRESGKTLPILPDHLEKKLVALARIISALRTGIARERDGGLLYRTRPEIGSRLATQLVKLGMALAILDDEKEISDDHYRLLQKVALDTACGFQLEITRELARHQRACPKNRTASTPYAGMTAKELEHRLQIPHSSLHRRLTDMQTIGVVKAQTPSKHTRKGRPTEMWTLSDEIWSLWNEAEIIQPLADAVPKQPVNIRTRRRHVKRVYAV